MLDDDPRGFRCGHSRSFTDNKFGELQSLMIMIVTVVLVFCAEKGRVFSGEL